MGLTEIIMVGLGVMEGKGSGIGWERFFVMHGIVAALLVSLGAPSCCATHRLVGSLPAGIRPPPKAETRIEMDWRDMLNTPLAVMMWMTFIFGATSGLMAIGQWTPMTKEVLGNATFVPESWGRVHPFLHTGGDPRHLQCRWPHHLGQDQRCH